MPAVPAAPNRRPLAVAVLLLALLFSSPASAVSIAVDGGWTNFSWSDGIGPIDSPSDGYQFTSATSVVVQITDSTLIGDVFEIFVNSVSVGLTSTPVGSGPSGAFSGPVAWADSRLSKIQLALGPGTYDIDIDVDTSIAVPAGGFIQVLSVVPEPGTLALLALGFAGLLWVTSARQPSARPSAPKR
jgi:hypothetical protein